MVIADGLRYVALVGSHRTYAMRRAFGRGEVPLHYVLVVPKAAVVAALAGRPGLLSLLDRYLREQLTGEFPLGGYEEIVRSVARLSPELAAALKDQT